MILNMKSRLLAFISIMIFSEGRSQDMSLLQSGVINSLFPKNPGLIRVRKLSQTERLSDGKVLDFVSKKLFLIKFMNIVKFNLFLV